MKEVNRKRNVSTQTFSFRPYEDTYREVMQICEASGRSPTDELRDILDEGLRSRHFPPGANPGSDQVLDALQQIASEMTEQLARIKRRQSEQFAVLLETLETAYGARHLTWKYLALPELDKEGLDSEVIRDQLLKEFETCHDAAFKQIRKLLELLKEGDNRP
jgi:hypothetical protein